jgi:hypothetical protein
MGLFGLSPPPPPSGHAVNKIIIIATRAINHNLDLISIENSPYLTGLFTSI